MAMLSFCGIDVSKDRLDVVVLPEGWFFSVSNDTAGWAELVARLSPLTVSAIGLEPSGGYERGIIRALLAAGLSVRRINPNKLRQFARARGVLAENDRLDTFVSLARKRAGLATFSIDPLTEARSGSAARPVSPAQTSHWDTNETLRTARFCKPLT